MVETNSTYSTTKDVFEDPEDDKDVYKADYLIKIHNVLTAIQDALGTSIEGSVADLATRLAKILSDSGALRNGTSFPETTEPGLIFFRTDEDKLYIRNAADSDWDEIGAGVDYDNGATFIEGSATTERTTASGSYVKVKEFSPLVRDGNVTVAWEQRNSDSGGYVYGKVYINGVAVGTEKPTLGITYAPQTESNISVSAGDVIQIYGKVSGWTGYMRNAYIKTANPTVPQEVSGY